ncbi:hypothetical protein Pcinc_031935 [Petrolisthes cinctipes]|uniref:Uncharacterized protein n=1 Tax=Petrolisthes cinctipes TaxID=88211 RepID=A0AAE1K030_PETCI|nr:hypothetical protein Pcinc_031935 [Petrolisthes cinctipes]
MFGVRLDYGGSTSRLQVFKHRRCYGPRRTTLPRGRTQRSGMQRRKKQGPKGGWIDEGPTGRRFQGVPEPLPSLGSRCGDGRNVDPMEDNSMKDPLKEYQGSLDHPQAAHMKSSWVG